MQEWDFQISENGRNVSDEWPLLQAEVRRGRENQGNRSAMQPETQGLDGRCWPSGRGRGAVIGPR